MGLAISSCDSALLSSDNEELDPKVETERVLEGLFSAGDAIEKLCDNPEGLVGVLPDPVLPPADGCSVLRCFRRGAPSVSDCGSARAAGTRARRDLLVGVSARVGFGRIALGITVTSVSGMLCSTL